MPDAGSACSPGCAHLPPMPLPAPATRGQAAASLFGAGGLRADRRAVCVVGSVRSPSRGSAAPARVRHGEPRAGDATDATGQAGPEHADAPLGPLAVIKRGERGPRSLAAWCPDPQTDSL